VLVEAGGLGFYNGGAQGGASQRHKHLQWIPEASGNASLAEWLAGLPRDAAPLATAKHAQLGFEHCFVRVDCRIEYRSKRRRQPARGFERALGALDLGVDDSGLLPPSTCWSPTAG